ARFPNVFSLEQTTVVDWTIYPGDMINTHCLYISSSRSSPTNFSVASDDEMCLEVLFYYPRIEGMSACAFNSPDTTLCGLYTDILQVPNPSITDPADLPRAGEWFGQPCVLPEVPEV